MYNIKLGQLVLVDWIDIATEAGWNDPTKVDFGRAHTVGYVSHIRGDGLVVSSGGMDGKLNGDPTIIPWACIETIAIVEFT